jgi:hypothetical protein
MQYRFTGFGYRTKDFTYLTDVKNYEVIELRKLKG